MDDLFQNLTDEALCARAVAGDGAAEEALLLRHTRLVRAAARPLFLAGGDSEDLLQEGFLGLLDAIRQFDGGREASFQTFAQVCVRNRLRSAVRSALRDKHAPLNSSLPLERAEETPDGPGGGDPEDLVIAQETWQSRLEAIETRLSPYEREVLGRYLDGLSYQEIARVTHTSAKSVDNAVQRVRRKLARP